MLAFNVISFMFSGSNFSVTVDYYRWVCHDFPELKLAVENYVLNDFDPTR